MIRGTSHIFKFDCSDAIGDFTDTTSFEARFEQSNNSNSPITKRFNVFWSANEGIFIANITGDSGCSVNVDTCEVLIELAPDETVLFTEDKKLKVQLTGTDSYGTFANYIQYITVYPMLTGQKTRAVSNTGTSSYILPVATASKLGGVKVASAGNINISGDGTISINKTSVTNALGYTPVKEGEAGTTEVHVGPNAPLSDNDIKLWVNTSEASLNNDGISICTIADGISDEQTYRVHSLPMAISQESIVVAKIIPPANGDVPPCLITSIIWNGSRANETKLCVSKVPGYSYTKASGILHYRVQVAIIGG